MPRGPVYSPGDAAGGDEGRQRPGQHTRTGCSWVDVSGLAVSSDTALSLSPLLLLCVGFDSTAFLCLCSPTALLAGSRQRVAFLCGMALRGSLSAAQSWQIGASRRFAALHHRVLFCSLPPILCPESNTVSRFAFLTSRPDCLERRRAARSSAGA